MIDELEKDFKKEVHQKHQEIYQAQEKLRIATQELAEARKKISDIQKEKDKIIENDLIIQRLELALSDEIIKNQRTLAEHERLQSQNTTIAETDPAKLELRALRSRITAYRETDLELRQQTADMKAKASEKEAQCKKLVAMCCNVSLGDVDGIIDSLLEAAESDGSNVDLIKVAEFIGRVKKEEVGEIQADSSEATSVGS